MNLPDFLVQDRYGYIHLAGHRIGLQDIVHFYNEGDSAEMLCWRFPSLPLSLVHKTIAFYLENQGEVDAYLAQCEAEIAEQRAAAREGPSLTEMRRRLQERRLAEGA